MRIFYFVVVLNIFISCGNGNPVPGNVLKQQQMQAVMWDILQADEFLKDYMLNKDSTLNDTLESVRLYEKVFQFHNTTRETFDTSFNYYRARPLLMKEILDSLHVKWQLKGPTPLSDSTDQLPPIFKDSTSAFPKIKRALRPD